jgi:hypothetical protein
VSYFVDFFTWQLFGVVNRSECDVKVIVIVAKREILEELLKSVVLKVFLGEILALWTETHHLLNSVQFQAEEIYANEPLFVRLGRIADAIFVVVVKIERKD